MSPCPALRRTPADPGVVDGGGGRRCWVWAGAAPLAAPASVWFRPPAPSHLAKLQPTAASFPIRGSVPRRPTPCASSPGQERPHSIGDSEIPQALLSQEAPLPRTTPSQLRLCGRRRRAHPSPFSVGRRLRESPPPCRRPAALHRRAERRRRRRRRRTQCSGVVWAMFGLHLADPGPRPRLSPSTRVVAGPARGSAVFYLPTAVNSSQEVECWSNRVLRPGPATALPAFLDLVGPAPVGASTWRRPGAWRTDAAVSRSRWRRLPFLSAAVPRKAPGASSWGPRRFQLGKKERRKATLPARQEGQSSTAAPCSSMA